MSASARCPRQALLPLVFYFGASADECHICGLALGLSEVEVTVATITVMLSAGNMCGHERNGS